MTAASDSGVFSEREYDTDTSEYQPIPDTQYRYRSKSTDYYYWLDADW